MVIGMVVVMETVAARERDSGRAEAMPRGRDAGRAEVMTRRSGGGERKRCRGKRWWRAEGMSMEGMVGERSEQCLGEARLWLASHS